MTLLTETIKDIRKSGHTIADIRYLGSRDGYSCTWHEFRQLADFDYDSGYGAAYVASDLEIVFNDGSVMRRHEYDGSECWMYSPPWQPPKVLRPIRTLQGGMWPTLAEQNDDERDPDEH